jgi:subtilisin-like proprotein convertase family protein
MAGTSRTDVGGRTGGFSPGFLWIIVSCLAGGLRAEGEAVLFRPPDRVALEALGRARAESLEPIGASWSPRTGRVRDLDGSFPLRAEDAGDLPAACLRFLRRMAPLFGWEDGIDLRVLSVREGMGTAHVRLGAFLDDLPIDGAEVVLHVRVQPASGPPSIEVVTASLVPGLTLSRDPAMGWLLPSMVSSAEAQAIAERAVGSRDMRGPTRARLELFTRPPPGRLVHAVWVDSVAPRGLHLVRVDAATGEVLSMGDLIRYGPPERHEGSGRVFIVSPIVALRDPSLVDGDDAADAVPLSAYATVSLPDLDGSGVLSGPYVSTALTPRSVRRVRLEFPLLRDHDGFEEVMAYYHIDSLQRFIQSLGFDDVNKRQVQVYANSEPPGIAYTDPQAYFLPDFEVPGIGIIAFGSGGVDSAEDPEVIAHEYGHAMQENQVPGFGGSFEDIETFAIGEGWSDFLSAAYLSAMSGGYGDLCLGEWFAVGLEAFTGENHECTRRLDSAKHYPESMVGEPHDDGEMWSASLWRIFEALGRESALRLIIQSNFYLPASATFEDAARAVVRADRELHASSNEDLITRIFLDRGFLRPPLDLTWFHVRKQNPSIPLTAGGGTVTSKLLIASPVSIPRVGPLLVYVRIVHPFPAAVSMSLRSPSGTTVVLHTAGSRILPPGQIVFGRNLDPAESLERLGGEHVSGVWALTLENTAFEEGNLIEWGLRFALFLRGDSDGDGALTVGDALVCLQHLFRGGEIPCAKAADFDDDGSLAVSDAIALLRFITGLGPAPPEPYPEPGEDLTEDSIPCGG